MKTFISDCNVFCVRNYSPVCGSDGVTYGNSCALEVAACQNPELKIVKDHAGPCKDTSATTSQPDVEKDGWLLFFKIFKIYYSRYFSGSWLYQEVHSSKLWLSKTILKIVNKLCTDKICQFFCRLLKILRL